MFVEDCKDTVGTVVNNYHECPGNYDFICCIPLQSGEYCTNSLKGKCMSAEGNINCKGTFEYGYCPGNQVCCIENDRPCNNRNGVCLSVDNLNQCSGTVVGGLCPGNNECCIQSDPSCKAINGYCMGEILCKIDKGTIVEGLCSNQEHKCCVPPSNNDNDSDSKCKAQNGQCMMASQCRGKIVGGLCPGSDSNTQCCIKTDTDSSCHPDYPCCKGCEVIYTDNDGDYGVENGDWCSIPKSCNSGNGGSGNGNGGDSDSKCKAQNGQCMMASQCRGKIVGGLCPGSDSNTQCCIPDDVQCNNIGGECIPESQCRTSIITGTPCSGNSDHKCCKDYNRIITSKALLYVGSSDWSFWSERQCELNDEVLFTNGEFKCNLFVYEVLLASGIDIGTPNSTGRLGNMHNKLFNDGKDKRPPTTND